MNTPEFYIFSTYASGMIAFFGAFYTLTIDRDKKFFYITIMFFGAGIWAMMDGLGIASPDYQTKISAATIAYFGIVLIPPSVLSIVLVQSDQVHRVHKHIYKLIWGFAVLHLIVVLTNPMHHLYWSSFEWGNYPVANNLNFLRGPIYSFFVVVTYFILGGAIYTLLYNLSYYRGILRIQSIGILIAILLPWSSHIFWFSRDPNLNDWDYTSTMLVVSVCLMVVSINFWRLFDLMPIVRDEIPELIAEGIVVVDEQDRVIYLNESAANMVGTPKHQMIGAKFSAPEDGVTSTFARADGTTIYYRTKTNNITRPSTAARVRVILLMDITNRMLNEEKINAYENERLIEVERKLIADRLHNSMAQGLFSLRLLTEEANRRLAEQKPVDDVIDEMNAAVRFAISEFRMTLFRLQNKASQLPLREFLELRVASVEERVGIQTVIHYSAPPAISADELDDVTSIASEALNNIVLHSKATKIDITVTKADGRFVLRVEDNGTGFDPEIKHPGHFGMENMLNRARNLNGEIKIDSANTGTIVNLTFRPNLEAK